MSVHKTNRQSKPFVSRWRDEEGKHRSRSFATREEAEAFDRQQHKKGNVLYHVVYKHETFEQAARALVDLVAFSQRESPGEARSLFLDIEGHRNPEGGFDHDMFELQKEFLIGYLLQFMTEIRTPLYHVRNNKGQRDDVPEGVYFEGQEAPPPNVEIREVVRGDDLA